VMPVTRAFLAMIFVSVKVSRSAEVEEKPYERP